jgi:hypothetical protein
MNQLLTALGLSTSDVVFFGFFGVLMVFAFGGGSWAIALQRRAMAKQQDAISQHEIGLARAEEAVALSRRSVELAERSVTQQDEIIRLLRTIAERND